MGAPQLGAGVGVVRRDEADVVLVALASRDPGDDPPLHDDGTARVPVAERGVGDLILPDDLTSARIERR